MNASNDNDEADERSLPAQAHNDRLLAVVPAFNEEGALDQCVRSLLTEHPETDVLIVNDGSTDGTQTVAAALAAEFPCVNVVRLPVNSGIGAAVQTGLVFAVRRGYRRVLQFDGDGQHDPAYVGDLDTAVADRGLDLCIGSRFLDDTDQTFRSTPVRRLGIRFFSGLISALCGVTVTDPTSGFRLYGPRAVRLFARHYPDDYPEPEAVLQCARNGLLVGEVPVRMRSRVSGMSSIRYLRSAYYMVKVTVAILIDRLRAREKPCDDS